MSTHIAYEPRKFNQRQMVVIEIARRITEEYEKQGFKLTVRGLYYQFVGRGFTNEWKSGANTQKSYNFLKGLMSKARRAGLISWTAIEDRDRHLFGTPFVESPRQAIEAARDAYTTDLWHNQAFRPQVWVEKNAQAGTVGRACAEFQVDYFPCKGYASDSALWEAGQRCLRYLGKGQRPIIFHLGDHDPSGIDMTRDNQEKLTMFTGTPVQVVRLMLNMNQIEQWRLPPNPAKMSDARAEAYVAEHGYSSWELDAAEPAEITKIIREAILKIRDPVKWDQALAERAEDRDRLDRIIEEMNL